MKYLGLDLVFCCFLLFVFSYSRIYLLRAFCQGFSDYYSDLNWLGLLINVSSRIGDLISFSVSIFVLLRKWDLLLCRSAAIRLWLKS